MNPKPLTRKQLADLDAVVVAKRLRVVARDEYGAELFINQAEDSLAQIPNITSHQVCYNIAYDAAHDVGEALLRAYGFRTGSGIGQHAAMSEFLVIIFAGSPAQVDSLNFDALRQGRNGSRYEALPRGSAQAGFATVTAQRLLDQARLILS